MRKEQLRLSTFEIVFKFKDEEKVLNTIRKMIKKNRKMIISYVGSTTNAVRIKR